MVKENDLSSLNETGDRIKIFRNGMRQTDLLIAKLHSYNDPSIVIGNDADFIMLLGRKSVQITSFTWRIQMFRAYYIKPHVKRS